MSNFIKNIRVDMIQCYFSNIQQKLYIHLYKRRHNATQVQGNDGVNVN